MITIGLLKGFLIELFFIFGIYKKMGDEEKLLSGQFAGYEEYKKRVKALVPFLF